MKNRMFLTIVIAAISALPMTTYAQKNVPQKTKAAFEKAYPNVHNTTWEKEYDNFEGNWKEGGVDHSAVFSPSGAFVASEIDIPPTQLPKAAISYLAKHQIKVKEASINKDAKGLTTYEADMKTKSYIFGKNGDFLKVSKAD